jgi:hypothetical protein
MRKHGHDPSVLERRAARHDGFVLESVLLLRHLLDRGLLPPDLVGGLQELLLVRIDLGISLRAQRRDIKLTMSSGSEA